MRVIGHIKKKKTKKVFVYEKDIYQEENNLLKIISSPEITKNNSEITISNGKTGYQEIKINTKEGFFSKNKIPVISLDFKILNFDISYSKTPFITIQDITGKGTFLIYSKDIEYFLKEIQKASLEKNFEKITIKEKKGETVFSALFILEGIAKHGVGIAHSIGLVKNIQDIELI